MSSGKGRYGPREKKTSIKNSIGRLLIFLALLIIQFYWVYNLLVNLDKKYPILSTVAEVLALLLVVVINENNSNVSMKVPFIILILAVPFMGVLLLILLEFSSNTWRIRRRFRDIDSKLAPYLSSKKDLLGEIGKESRRAKNIFRYLKNYAGYPAYNDTDIKYFKEASLALDDLVEDLKSARDFIFMEYHAIEDRESFRRIHEVLREKAASGVEVRILYDDIGSFVFINHDFIKRMAEDKIKARVFNPMMPVFNLFINNRDHRKYTIIDGKVAFTGGFNIANEYFNVTSPYGHWKDTGVRIEGPAVDSLTSMFLEMWNVSKKKDQDTDMSRFFNRAEPQVTERGFICPYAD
ncbi:MAG TPA: cardiolipin synthase, partial [Clostridiales bacterium]|nr:cardiolipin synthase [Clostridiales bacterium]